MMNKKNKNKVELTTRGRHAVSAMIELARESDSDPVSLSQIADLGNISLSYLEQLFSCLRRHGLVKSYRGPGGGYTLSRSADEIFVADILVAAETFLEGKQPKRKSATYYPGTQQLWEKCGHILHQYLETTSLQDVMDDDLPESSV